MDIVGDGHGFYNECDQTMMIKTVVNMTNFEKFYDCNIWLFYAVSKYLIPMGFVDGAASL